MWLLTFTTKRKTDRHRDEENEEKEVVADDNDNDKWRRGAMNRDENVIIIIWIASCWTDFVSIAAAAAAAPAPTIDAAHALLFIQRTEHY